MRVLIQDPRSKKSVEIHFDRIDRIVSEIMAQGVSLVIASRLVGEAIPAG